MARHPRITAILTRADEATRELTAAAPASRTAYRAKTALIADVCRDLVCGKPAQEPTSILVSELGRTRHVGFPASQTLLNGYGDLLRIWRRAYSDVISANAPKSSAGRSGLQLSDEELGTLDAGARAHVILLVQLLKEANVETDRLRKLVKDNVPITVEGLPAASTKALAAPSEVDTSPLRAWLADNEDGRTFLDLDTAGLVASRRTRPGIVVVSAEVLEIIRSLLGPPT